MTLSTRLDHPRKDLCVGWHHFYTFRRAPTRGKCSAAPWCECRYSDAWDTPAGDVAPAGSASRNGSPIEISGAVQVAGAHTIDARRGLGPLPDADEEGPDAEDDSKVQEGCYEVSGCRASGGREAVAPVLSSDGSEEGPRGRQRPAVVRN